MDGQKQDDQLEHASSSYVRIRDVALKTCQRRSTIWRSGERGSGISVVAARHDDNDDDERFVTLIYGISTIIHIIFSNICCIAMIQLYVYIYMQKHNQQ